MAPEADVPGRRSPARTDAAAVALARELVGIRELLKDLVSRTRMVDDYVAEVRKLGELASTTFQTVGDNARRLTNLEDGRQENATRITSHDARLQILDRHMERSRIYQERLHLEDMAPRELEIFPDAMREFLDQREAEVSLEQQLERRMRIAVAYATVVNAVFAAFAVVVAYWVARH